MEVFMGTVLSAIIWAIVGAILYKVSSTIISIGKYTIFSKMVLFHCLTLLGSVVEDVEFTKQLKHKQMVDTGLTDDQIAIIQELDQRALDNWKENAILIVINSFPGPLSNIVKFNNWKEAMYELDKFHRTN
tara:strand:- start:894 stop:1286 length:393 start_codon:yes stop_codon:yes gene_type:complete